MSMLRFLPTMMMRSIDEDDGDDINDGMINVVRDKANRTYNCQSCILVKRHNQHYHHHHHRCHHSQHYDRYHHPYYHIQNHI